MKIYELIALLERHDRELEVIMSKDGEGNDFSPLADVNEGSYRPDTTWSGEVVPEYDNEPPESIPCITLWPMN